MPQMTFDEKIKALKNIPIFRVLPISEIKAIAFSTKEERGRLVLTPEDIRKIVREYPDLASKLSQGNLT